MQHDTAADASGSIIIPGLCSEAVLTVALSCSCNCPVEELPPHTPKSSSAAGALQQRPPVVVHDPLETVTSQLNSDVYI